MTEKEPRHSSSVEWDERIKIGACAVDSLVGGTQHTQKHQANNKTDKRKKPGHNKQKHTHELERKAELYRRLSKVGNSGKSDQKHYVSRQHTDVHSKLTENKPRYRTKR